MFVPLLVGLALVLAPAASAGDRLLVVGEDGIQDRYDPYLPPDAMPLTPGPRPAKVSGGPTVTQSLEIARRKGGISQARYERYTRIYKEARLAISRRGIAKKCRTQMARVLGLLGNIAARGHLNGGRMAALFLQLRRNTEFWTQGPNVRLGERVSFEKDPLVFQHYKGYGIQIQPLGSAGKANGLWNQCIEEPDKCRGKTLHAMLDSLVRITSWRAGAKTWEYWFPFGGGLPPWASGMAQATAMQALSRGALFFGEPRFMITAEKALPLFLKPPPAGVRVRAHGGYHYLLYSFSPGLRVLNAFLQAVTGLYDYAKLSGDKRAKLLFRRGDKAARREVPRYDTGKWSYYSRPLKNLSTLDYHALVTGFLENLCERTGTRVYCRVAKRFARYLERRGGLPPGGGTPPVAGPRCGYL